MARTLVGQLLLRLKDDMSGPSKKAAREVSNSIRDIERNAKRLNAAPWGGGFQRQLDKVGASGKKLEALEHSWTRLHRTILDKNLKGALKRSEISNWKASTLRNFAEVRAGMASTEKRALQMRKSMSGAMRPAFVALGGYTGTYMIGRGARFGFQAGASRSRELFRQDMSGISKSDQKIMGGKSRSLAAKYQSLPITEVMELSRISRNLMGGTARGMAVMEPLVKTLVTLQSTKGVDAATSEIEKLLRAFDNMGVNKDGVKGIEAVSSLLDTVMKASQVEGRDFDLGSFLNFARRSKIAGPALSQDFLGTVGPALMQDLGADSAGNMLAMFFKNFVTGKVGKGTSKEDLAMRKKLGLLANDGRSAINSSLAGTNPYAWAQQYLKPGLINSGVDLNNPTDVAKMVSKLSGNTNVTGLLTRLITQSEQINRSIILYAKAMGISAADRVQKRDPNASFAGLIASFENLSSATLPMDAITSKVNSFSGAMNNLAVVIENSDSKTKMALSGAGMLAGGFAAYKGVQAVTGLISAGTNLNLAAAALQRAAAMQAGGNALDGVGGKVKGKIGGVGKGKMFLNGVGSLSMLMNAPSTLAEAKKNGERLNTFVENVISSPSQIYGSWNAKNNLADRHKSYRARRPTVGQTAGYAAIDAGYGNQAGWASYAAKIGEKAEQESAKAGAQIKKNLSVDANSKVNIDDSALDRSITKAQKLLGILNQVGTASKAAATLSDNALRQSFADHGVAP